MLTRTTLLSAGGTWSPEPLERSQKVTHTSRLPHAKRRGVGVFTFHSCLPLAAGCSWGVLAPHPSTPGLPGSGTEPFPHLGKGLKQRNADDGCWEPAGHARVEPEGESVFYVFELVCEQLFMKRRVDLRAASGEVGLPTCWKAWRPTSALHTACAG